MSDIFISYASEDRSRAEPIAKALEEQGWSVWWDRTIPPGKTFDQVIEEAINAAGCVVVLWSEESIKSDWVKEEAAIAHERGILVPAKIDPISPPLGFGRIQAADLTDWKDDANNPGFSALLDSITGITGPPGETDRVNFSKPPDTGENKQQDRRSLKSTENKSFIADQIETHIDLVTAVVSLTALIAVTVFIKLRYEEPDPFLPWYIIAVIAVVIITWVVLKFTDSEIQVLATKLTFLLFGFLATVAVIWRGIEKDSQRWLKLFCGTYEYMPYVYLIAVGVAVSLLIIFVYTRAHSRRANRLPIYTYFIFLCMYLITCRLIWAYLDGVYCSKN
jgi:hypothetical protein